MAPQGGLSRLRPRRLQNSAGGAAVRPLLGRGSTPAELQARGLLVPACASARSRVQVAAPGIFAIHEFLLLEYPKVKLFDFFSF